MQIPNHRKTIRNLSIMYIDLSFTCDTDTGTIINPDTTTDIGADSYDVRTEQPFSQAVVIVSLTIKEQRAMTEMDQTARER